MSAALTRTLVSLCWPALVPLAAVAIWLQSRVAPPAGGAAWALAPYAAFGAAAVLGWRFNRSRALFAALTLGFTAEVLTPGSALAAQLGLQGEAVRLAARVVVPVALGITALLPEKGLLTPTGLLRWVVLGAAGAGLYLAAHDPTWAERFGMAVGGVPLEWLALGIGGAALIARFAHGRGAVESGLIGALAAFALALQAEPGSIAAQAYVTTAGLTLVLALVETTYTLAYRDELTGLPARRALNETLRALGGRYTVAMVDVDHFKKFNDKYGHDAGDQALRMVAGCLGRVRGGGKAFRYGGEEFTIVFPGRSAEEAVPHLEAVRRALADTPFTIRAAGRPRKKPEQPRAKGQRKQVKVTASIGAAERGRSEPPDAVLKRADKLLYAAKKGGRNQVAS